MGTSNILLSALTLTLSPGEREQPLAILICSKAAEMFSVTRYIVRWKTILPLLGERAGVRAENPS